MPRLLLFAVLCIGTPCLAETLYISDVLTVPLRRGPGSTYKITVAAIPSGTALEVLGVDKTAGFTQVRMTNGTEGWLPSQYLTPQPIARDRLAAAQQRITSLETQLKTSRETSQRVGDAESRAARLQKELEELRRVSGSAVAQYEENKTLKAENRQLQAKLGELGTQVGQLRRGTQLRFLVAGGALVLIGLALGAWIRSRIKRRSW